MRCSYIALSSESLCAGKGRITVVDSQTESRKEHSQTSTFNRTEDSDLLVTMHSTLVLESAYFKMLCLKDLLIKKLVCHYVD